MKAISLYLRLVRKVVLITQIETESPTGSSLVQDRFNKIVDQWSEGGNMEDDVKFLSLSGKRDFIPPSMEGNQRLKHNFGDIVPTATSIKLEGDHSADAETRLSRVASLTTEAFTLLNSKFFKSFDKPRPESKNPIPHLDENFTWCLKLRQRLRRVAQYFTQLDAFARG